MSKSAQRRKGQLQKAQARKQSLPIVANTLSRQLALNGVVVHRYHSRSTKSFYLKLDYGLARTVRISDHYVPTKLAFRYNILSPLSHPIEVVLSSGIRRYFYPPNDYGIDQIVEDVLHFRNDKIAKIGAPKYRRLMRVKYLQDRNSPFWRKAQKYKFMGKTNEDKGDRS